MSKISIEGNASGTGTLTIAAPNTNSNFTLDIPSASGTIDRLNRAGNVLQVVSTTKTDTFTTTSTSFVDVTGLSVSITPSSASNKILVICTIPISHGSSRIAMANLVRGSTAICQVASPQTFSSSKTAYVQNGDTLTNSDLHFLDSPNTTSSTTYKIQVKTNVGDIAMFVGQRANGDAATPSTITVMEIAG